MSEVNEVVSAWRRIAGWLREHAPVSAEALQPGASDEEIATLKRRLRCEIPQALEAWLRVNNGSTAKDVRESLPGGGIALRPHRDSVIFPDGMRFLGCQEIADQYADYLHIAGDIQDDDYWKPWWIPVAAKSDGPYGIILDAQTSYDPSPLLKFREGDYPSSYLPSLTDFLRPFADLLERGEAPGTSMEYKRFFVADGRIAWSS
ncbi:cell wall assembly regulator SMI1 [Streptomyces puniciscabiei]|uniref:Cell wall assembly regulator SMI1 n=1 Tax=Streptomyces puniciscabiei TaxID=164348 RepID=A0A542SX94_9ACTN|nr:SMI1/KNR4 family protein [Streptomyces puniciscabiei]TQK79221.1 cell wall assembly regulator SMI1 [Streptomyces puniciscabiei]